MRRQEFQQDQDVPPGIMVKLAKKLVDFACCNSRYVPVHHGLRQAILALRAVIPNRHSIWAPYHAFAAVFASVMAFSQS